MYTRCSHTHTPSFRLRIQHNNNNIAQALNAQWALIFVLFSFFLLFLFSGRLCGFIHKFRCAACCAAFHLYVVCMDRITLQPYTYRHTSHVFSGLLHFFSTRHMRTTSQFASKIFEGSLFWNIDGQNSIWMCIPHKYILSDENWNGFSFCFSCIISAVKWLSNAFCIRSSFLSFFSFHFAFAFHFLLQGMVDANQ